MKKRVIALFLVCLMMLSVACTQGTTTATTKTAGTTVSGGATTQAAATTVDAKYNVPFSKTIEISLLGSIWSPYKAEMTDIWKEIETRCNVKLNFEWAPQEGYKEKVTTTLAGGKLPDMFAPGLDIFTLTKEGAITPLDDYLKYAPNYTANVGANDGSLIRYAADGKLYQLNFMTDYKPAYAMVIRKDWLTNLGLSVPKTWNEWVTTWKAFRDQDANKNGDVNDEIPLIDPATFTSGKQLASMLMVFGIKSNGLFYYDDAGKYGLVYDNPNYKAYLTAMRMLYTENLVDKEVFTHTPTDVAQLFNTNVAGSGYQWISRPQNTTLTLAATVPEVVLAPVAPIVGPNGDQLIPERAKYGTSWVISSQAESSGKIEYIMSMVNYLYSENGTNLLNYGVEGKQYTVVNGEKVLTADIVSDSTFIKAREAGLIPQPFLCRWTKEQYNQVLTKNKKYSELVLADQLMVDGTTMYWDYYFTQPATLSTDAWGKYSADLMAKIDELRAKCITGSITVDQFFTEYDKLRTNGIDEINKQAQVAYDKVNK